MDAKAQLRAFLEQRLEAGETELVFEHLSADQAVHILERLASRGAVSSDWRAVLTTASREPSVGDTPVDRQSSVGGTTGSGEAPAWLPPPKPGAPPVEPHPIRPGLAVGTSEAELFAGELAQLASLGAVAEKVAGCTRCPLYQTAKNPVPGEGRHDADLVVVGEAPGATEDETGRPFVGAAGQLLTKILAAINLSRNDVFICNVLKHRPPQNRNPLPHEVEACSPYLLRQLDLIRPKAILAVGTFAAQTLLQTNQGIGQLRGLVHRYYGIPLVVTYHPAALLRNPGWKRPTWEDVKLIRRIIDSASVGA